jgi:hypothetical protein
MSGSNGRGMSGSNGRGMSGSNGRGMSGSNGRGMSGSNGRGHVLGGAFARGFELAAMGPVETISANGAAATLVVVGQEFAVTADDVSQYAVGDYVVAGATTRGATAVVYHVGAPYVPGASTVRVKASVDSVNPAVANLTVGALTVDYAQQLTTNPGFSVAKGETIEAEGIQPSPRGLLLVPSSGEGVSVVSGEETIAGRR